MSPASVMEPARIRQHTYLGFLKGFLTEETIFEMWAGLKWSTGIWRHSWQSTGERQPHHRPKDRVRNGVTGPGKIQTHCRGAV